jgi:hypothetical protein
MRKIESRRRSGSTLAENDITPEEFLFAGPGLAPGGSAPHRPQKLDLQVRKSVYRTGFRQAARSSRLDAIKLTRHPRENSLTSPDLPLSRPPPRIQRRARRPHQPQNRRRALRRIHTRALRMQQRRNQKQRTEKRRASQDLHTGPPWERKILSQNRTVELPPRIAALTSRGKPSTTQPRQPPPEIGGSLTMAQQTKRPQIVQIALASTLGHRPNMVGIPQRSPGGHAAQPPHLQRLTPGRPPAAPQGPISLHRVHAAQRTNPCIPQKHLVSQIPRVRPQPPLMHAEIRAERPSPLRQNLQLAPPAQRPSIRPGLQRARPHPSSFS